MIRMSDRIHIIERDVGIEKDLEENINYCEANRKIMFSSDVTNRITIIVVILLMMGFKIEFYQLSFISPI